MELTKLFEMQKVLGEHIEKEHPRVKGEDRFAKKVLALQTEIAECANEWRGFKFWSKDREPRNYYPNPNDSCVKCAGQGYHNSHLDMKDWIFCEECDGCGIQFYNPLLEEYVDCLHLILSIGLEIGKEYFYFEPMVKKEEDITSQFIVLFHYVYLITEDNYCSELFTSFVYLGEMLGFTWEQIEQAYFDKNEINHARQQNGY